MAGNTPPALLASRGSSPRNSLHRPPSTPNLPASDSPHDTFQRNHLLDPVRGFNLEAPALILLPQLPGPRVQLCRLPTDPGNDRLLRGGRGLLPGRRGPRAGDSRAGVEPGLHDSQSRGPQLTLQQAALVAVYPHRLPPPSPHDGMLPLEGLPGLLRADGNDLIAVQQPQRKSMKPSPLQPLHDRGPLRPARPRDRGIVEPLVMVARDFEIGGPHQPAAPAARGLGGGRLGLLPFRHLAKRPPTVG